LLWGAHDGKRATVAFRHAVALDPKNTDAWFGYGQALYRLGQSRSLDAFASYASLCSEGERCAADDQQWLRRFLRDPYTYVTWPGVVLRWSLLSLLL
jgi:hypothetical protein